MDINMGAGQRMIPDTAAQARFQNFLKTYHGKKLVVLELGIGWRNQLIKAPMMRLVASRLSADVQRLEASLAQARQTPVPAEAGFDTSRAR